MHLSSRRVQRRLDDQAAAFNGDWMTKPPRSTAAE
jgi:hypothetical protein